MPIDSPLPHPQFLMPAVSYLLLLLHIPTLLPSSLHHSPSSCVSSVHGKHQVLFYPLLPLMIKLSWGVASTFTNSYSLPPTCAVQRVPYKVTSSSSLLNTIDTFDSSKVSKLLKNYSYKKTQQQTSIHSVNKCLLSSY